MDVNETLLPGVGVRYEFHSVEGDLIGVVAHRNGEFQIVVYDAADPDQCREAFRLGPAGAEVLAQILGAPRIAERFADLSREIPGLVTGQVVVPPDGPFTGEPLGHTRARSRTGASVVAIVRGQKIINSPVPEEVIRSGDVLVVIGSEQAIGEVDRIVTRG